jgi:hypothetical protein
MTPLAFHIDSYKKYFPYFLKKKMFWGKEEWRMGKKKKRIRRRRMRERERCRVADCIWRREKDVFF